ncbi:hypothetical protein BESB_068050 [Besnoitia besnoiti]|uniref:Generative cell specific-1/HAP2 domain-containing protein n=1 Tax=Besnoitia besnoiti TaxID=94643 RepID=A0A2A9MH87_BESBE|nr:hypothetical protein BESB_068050 [Besnoitia besnoiti]PFH34772.1 hypothetical protein BESB_068050 [Besnoitia besnoiti]
MEPTQPPPKAAVVAVFLVFLLAGSTAHGGIPRAVTREQICTVNGAYDLDDPRRIQCKDTIVGTLRISNKEKFSFNVTQDTIDSRDKKYADVGNAGFLVTITKTPVTISLPLDYIKDVPFDYREEIYEYSRWEAGRRPDKFCYEDTVDKCSEDGKLAAHPQGKPLSWAHGRCCWCSEVLAFTHINNMKRGNFRCNWFAPPRALQLVTQTLFDRCEAGKEDGTVPPDRDCEREKHERAGLTDRIYTLNYTTPEVFDRSVYCNIKSCLKHAMILDKDYVSVTGYECDKVGTGLDRWGDMRGEFCHLLPGSCMSGQLRKFKEIDRLRIEQNLVPLYALKREFGGFPRYAPDPMNVTNLSSTGTRHYLGYDFGEEHFSDILFEMDATDITWLRATSPGHISFIEVPQLDICSSSTIGGCPLKSYVWNAGNEDANFAVEVPFCIDSESKERTIDVNPITPVRSTVPANEMVVFTLNFKTISSSALRVTCFMKLYDAQHLMLDQQAFNVTTADAEEDKDGLSNFERFFGIPPNPAGGTPICPCSWYNVICFLFRFRTCFAALKATIMTIVGVVLAGILLFFFGPILFPFLRIALSCFCGFARSFIALLAVFVRKYCSCLVKLCGMSARCLRRFCLTVSRFARRNCGMLSRGLRSACASLSRLLNKLCRKCVSACAESFGRHSRNLKMKMNARKRRRSGSSRVRLKLPTLKQIGKPATPKLPKIPAFRKRVKRGPGQSCNLNNGLDASGNSTNQKRLSNAVAKTAGGIAALGLLARQKRKTKKEDHTAAGAPAKEEQRKIEQAPEESVPAGHRGGAMRLTKKEKRALRYERKKLEYRQKAHAASEVPGRERLDNGISVVSRFAANEPSSGAARVNHQQKKERKTLEQNRSGKPEETHEELEALGAHDSDPRKPQKLLSHEQTPTNRRAHEDDESGSESSRKTPPVGAIMFGVRRKKKGDKKAKTIEERRDGDANEGEAGDGGEAPGADVARTKGKHEKRALEKTKKRTRDGGETDDHAAREDKGRPYNEENRESLAPTHAPGVAALNAAHSEAFDEHDIESNFSTLPSVDSEVHNETRMQGTNPDYCSSMR